MGLSGGIDSVVLLHALSSLHKAVSAVHVDHGLSPNSEKWSEFCRELCDDWGISLSISRVIVESRRPEGLEAAARRVRHTVFTAVDSDWLALGHHRGDRAETMLFNLLRGTGVRGAGAMPERRGRLLRPLLPVGRREILQYAETHGLRWVEDESNADTRHSRNFLRHRIIPAIQQRFPAVESRLASAAGRFAEAADLLDDLAKVDLGTHPARFPVPVAVLAKLPDVRARNVLRFLLACHGVGMPSEERVVEALRQFVEAGVDKHPSLTFGHVRMLRRKGLVVIEQA